MTHAPKPVRLESLWDESVAAGMNAAERLVYRSNLLGSDLRITNYGGGNTSVKTCEVDPLTGALVPVLWVKGSGGDLGSLQKSGLASLYLDKVLGLEKLYRGLAHEDEMVSYLPHCTFALNPRAASIDTPLHAFIPHKHVDHMHPDAVIAIACAQDSENLTAEIFGGKIGWLPWQRPGFDLGLKLGALARAQPDLQGVLLQGHGLFTWAQSGKACYQTTLQTINQAADWLASRDTCAAFGAVTEPKNTPPARRQEVAAALMPVLRGLISQDEPKIGHFCDSASVLEFVNSAQVHALAHMGTSCPDHFLRTKIRPLVLEVETQGLGAEAISTRAAEVLPAQLAAYRADYEAYYRRCADTRSPAMRDANAVVYLLPGIGMMSFAKDKATARIASEFYTNAINVMKGAQNAGGYVGLEEREAFNIEYWALEEAKLQRLPEPRALAGKIAFITGGGGGIGAATARRLLRDGACVMLADIDAAALAEVTSSLSEEFGADTVASVACDVTREASVHAAMAQTAVQFGGLDILVSNAGIASSAPLDETSLDLWGRTMDVLATGYFLVTREAFKVMKQQALGGAIVFVASKNALVASANAAAYCTAKGAELQLARVVALEGAPLGIRCNVVNPDAVLRGSRIWSSAWKQERAAAYAIDEDELEAHYRQRSLLKRAVLPEDVAEAIGFFVSEVSAKSTGNILNVDAGHAAAFTR